MFAVPKGGTSVRVLNMGSYGTFSFDYADYLSVFNIIGWALVFAACWVSGKLIIANKG